VAINNVFKAILLTFSALASANSNAAANCVLTNSGAVDGSDLMNEHIVNDEGKCFLSPIALEATFYSISFCTEEPKPDTYQQVCSRVMHFPSGKTIPIQIGKSTTLFDDGISIPEGNYPYAAMLLGNVPRIKAEVTFDEVFTGANNTSGTKCWTNGGTARGSNYAYGTNNVDFAITCGASPQAQWSSRKYMALKNPTNSYKYGNTAPYLDIGGPKSSYIMADENTIATVTPDSNNPWDEDLVQSNGTMILSVQKFTTPTVISTETENIDLGFNLTDNYWVEITSDSSTNPHNSNMGCTPVVGSIGCATSFQIRKLDFFANAE